MPQQDGGSVNAAAGSSADGSPVPSRVAAAEAGPQEAVASIPAGVGKGLKNLVNLRRCQDLKVSPTNY
jgi:hypothetical protein